MPYVWPTEGSKQASLDGTHLPTQTLLILTSTLEELYNEALVNAKKQAEKQCEDKMLAAR